MADQITVSEALAWQKTLKGRHAELVGLRNENANRERTYYGQNANKETVKEPLYDAKALDQTVTRIARELRILDEAIKRSNAKTKLAGYERDDAVLGELQSPS